MRRAAALPVVLLALTLMTALVVAGAHVTRHVAVATRVVHAAIELDPVPEAAVATALTSWDSATMAALEIGATRDLGQRAGTSARTSVWVTRLTTTTYWIVAEASTLSRPALRRRLGALISTRAGEPRRVNGTSLVELP